MARYKHRLARLLQQFPWIIALVYHGWRLFQARYAVGAVGVLFNDAGKVLLVKHAFHPRTPWGLPGGWVDRQENPAQTIQREMQEELALSVIVGPVLLMDVPHRGHLDVAFLCTTTDSVGQLSYELLDYDWVDPAALPRVLEFHYHAIQTGLRTLNHDQPPQQTT